MPWNGQGTRLLSIAFEKPNAVTMLSRCMAMFFAFTNKKPITKNSVAPAFKSAFTVASVVGVGPRSGFGNT